MSGQFPNEQRARGSFPGWSAVVGMVLFPLIGVFIVGLTAWKLRSKVLVGVGGCVLWILAVGLLFASSHAGPTPA
jgi:hypothetical protein